MVSTLGGKCVSALHVAAKEGDIDMVRKLVDKGANTDIQGEGYDVAVK